MVWFTLACTPDAPPSEPEDTSTPPASTPTTADTAATPGSTADTAAPTTPWDGLYPAAPYDCALGVPAGPPVVRVVEGVRTTEDFVFDLDGWLVGADFAQNLVRWAPDGTFEVFSPGAG